MFGDSCIKVCSCRPSTPRGGGGGILRLGTAASLCVDGGLTDGGGGGGRGGGVYCIWEQRCLNVDLNRHPCKLGRGY